MQPIYADFSVTPARLGNVTSRHGGCVQRDGHLGLLAGGSVEFAFDLAEEDVVYGATLCVTSMVPLDDEPWGYLRMEVLLNGETLFDSVIVSQRDSPSDSNLGIPGDRLLPGRNTLVLRARPDAPGTLRLHRVTLDPSNRPGQSLRALTDLDAPRSVFAFDTQARPDGGGAWRAGRPVLVHLDREGPALLRQLSWRNADGSEAAVAFQSGMTEFYGHHRTADGQGAEFRGRLSAARVFPAGTEGVVVHRFHTQEGWGGGWHASGDLRLAVEDGSGDVARISWRDQRDESGSVVLRTPPPGSGRGEVTGLVATVRADRENLRGGEIADNLLDGVRGAKWLAFSDRADLLFSFDRQVTVRHYVLVSANDFAERDPRDWTLEGSNDTRSWTVLDSRTGVSFSERHQPRAFTFAGERAYRHLRLRISRTGCDVVQLAQVRFFEAASPALGFTGFYQRVGEGPIGYRGTAAEPAGPREPEPFAGSAAGAFAGRPMTPFSNVAASALTAAVPGRPLSRAATAGVPAKAGEPVRATAPAEHGEPVELGEPVEATAPADAGEALSTVEPVSAFSEPVSAFAEATAAVPAEPASPTVAAEPGEPAEPAEPGEPSAPATDPRLTTVDGWRAFLREYSADFLRVADENERFNVTDEQTESGWLGFEGAGEAEIAELEGRLGTPLPPSYRTFLATSDGWHQLGSSMWEMRTAKEVGWFRDVEPETCDILDEGDDELGALVRRGLLISREGDAEYWFLDPETVSPDGEWAAYTWSSWAFLSDEYPSFAALVAAEREACEELWGQDGRPVRTEGADELVAEGRALALRGEVDAALAAFDRATVRGSGAGLYLKSLLGAFLDLRNAHHTLRNSVLSTPHVAAAIGPERMRAEAVPLFLRAFEADQHARPEHYLPMVREYLPETDTGSPTGPDAREYWLARRAAFVPPVLDEPSAFQKALAHARHHVAIGDPEGAWNMVRHSLTHWHSDDPHAIAPVILLTDPAFREVVTDRRARLIVRTPRGEGRAPEAGG
ncbi:SMI1/KNR4 family protein [Streptomyces sp. TS71-3]|uniref:SMI1/KNR4 family protein n=1 Tax=Streptomyces sp. TS71-3 TaxID=2733862 RepID=UPI001B07E84F|nr:SMI1/KNR4 family protein [Streptomyces sp. TS71-3]GHJ36946.1 hypothetical protein Sm713_25550 [Streptomyces sp. TS71-3]